MKEALTYDDILLTPQYSDIKSRKEVNLISALDASLILDLPIISSPMDTVTESEMAYAMDSLGGLGVIHRYNSIRRTSWFSCGSYKRWGYKELEQPLELVAIILKEHRHL